MTQELLGLAEKLTDNLSKLERSIQDAEEGWQRFISSDDYLYLSVVALNLHGFYTGAEKQFTLIAKILQERISSNAQWHERLLQHMATAVSGLRPAVISRNSRDALDEYRRFRHLVRNLYPFDLEADKIQPLVASAPNTLALLRSDLLAFAAFLENQARDHTGNEIS